MTTVGITGHQNIPLRAHSFIQARITSLLDLQPHLIGVTSLAAGADQIFAREVLRLGGSLEVIVPCSSYEASFADTQDLQAFRDLVRHATRVQVLPFDSPTEEAYLEAGKQVAQRSEFLIAVWDGQPARGKGGTADVVLYAQSLGKEVQVLWPPGVSR